MEEEEDNAPPEAEVVEKSPRERYLRFKDLIGQGAYKQVWRAYDTIEGIEVAWNVVNLKKMPPAEKVSPCAPVPNRRPRAFLTPEHHT